MFDTIKIKNQEAELAEHILLVMYPNSPFSDATRREKAIQDIKWMLLFIIEGYQANNPKIVRNFIRWLKGIFKGIHIKEFHADLLFEKTCEVLKDTLHSDELTSFLKSVYITEPMMKYDTNNPYKAQQKLYLDLLLSSNKNGAKKLIDQLVSDGLSVEDIYLYIFQETMYEVGNLWQIGSIKVGREHYCTAVTQYLMSTLYPIIFNREHSNKRIIACAVGSELHELGIRMVADFFEMDGWNTNYLGPNLPYNEIIDFARAFEPHVIALSTTMPFHLSVLKNTISAIKKTPSLAHIKIIVGGLPFLDNPDLYKYVGADAVAINAKEGIEIANQLIQ